MIRTGILTRRNGGSPAFNTRGCRSRTRSIDIVHHRTIANRTSSCQRLGRARIGQVARYGRWRSADGRICLVNSHLDRCSANSCLLIVVVALGIVPHEVCTSILSGRQVGRPTTGILCRLFIGRRNLVLQSACIGFTSVDQCDGTSCIALVIITILLGGNGSRHSRNWVCGSGSLADGLGTERLDVTVVVVGIAFHIIPYMIRTGILTRRNGGSPAFNTRGCRSRTRSIDIVHHRTIANRTSSCQRLGRARIGQVARYGRWRSADGRICLFDSKLLLDRGAAGETTGTLWHQNDLRSTSIRIVLVSDIELVGNVLTVQHHRHDRLNVSTCVAVGDGIESDVVIHVDGGSVGSSHGNGDRGHSLAETAEGWQRSRDGSRTRANHRHLACSSIDANDVHITGDEGDIIRTARTVDVVKERILSIGLRHGGLGKDE